MAQSRVSVWDLMQRRVAVFLSAAPTTSFTLEQFADAYQGVCRFITIGEAFSASDSLGLKTALRFKAKAYLSHFHRERLDELRMRLETEMWRPLPLQVEIY